MKIVMAAVLFAAVAPVTPALAQAASSDSSLPESMRIEQSVTQQNANDPNMPANRGTRPTTEAPGGAAAPVEMNRLDPAAPSSQRLQIDDGKSAAVRQNPDVNALHPGSAGTSYNTILRGSSSTNGASPGTSGMGSSGAAGSSTSPGAGNAGEASGGSSGGSR